MITDKIIRHDWSDKNKFVTDIIDITLTNFFIRIHLKGSIVFALKGEEQSKKYKCLSPAKFIIVRRNGNDYLQMIFEFSDGYTIREINIDSNLEATDLFFNALFVELEPLRT